MPKTRRGHNQRTSPSLPADEQAAQAVEALFPGALPVQIAETMMAGAFSRLERVHNADPRWHPLVRRLESKVYELLKSAGKVDGDHMPFEPNQPEREARTDLSPGQRFRPGI